MWTPLFSVSLPGSPGEGVTIGHTHHLPSCLNCRLEFESRVSRPWAQAGTRGQIWHVHTCVGSPRAIVGKKKTSIEFWPDSIGATYLSIKHLPRADQKKQAMRWIIDGALDRFLSTVSIPSCPLSARGVPSSFSFWYLLVFSPFWSWILSGCITLQ